MKNSNFPLELYVGGLVKFLDTIEYHDDNYDHHERLKTLQYVYSETAKHFAQPLQQDTLKVKTKRLAAVMRTSVQVVVFCWVKVSLEVMVAISIYFVYIVLLDDSNNDPHPDMGSFFEDVLHGNEQKHPFWRLMNAHLSDFLRHYGSFCGLAIFRSTLDFFQGCWIETHDFQGFPGSDYFPLFLRRLNGLGGICGGSLFPANKFDERVLFNEITTAIAQIEPQVAFVNDLISFYKEFDSPRDQVSLVTNVCQVEGIPLQQAFDRLTDDTIRSCEQLKLIFDAGKTPALAASIHAFVQGYVTWHFCDPRFRMREVYERSGETPHGTKFRYYYEAAMKVGSIDVEEWAMLMVATNGFGESHGVRESNGIKESNGVGESHGVKESNGVEESNSVAESNGVEESNTFEESKGVEKSNGVETNGVEENNGAKNNGVEESSGAGSGNCVKISGIEEVNGIAEGVGEEGGVKRNSVEEGNGIRKSTGGEEIMTSRKAMIPISSDDSRKTSDL
jgi:trichodiene synthase